MRILIVEDDETTAKVLSTILSQQNYTIETAADGQLAWELIESSEFDLVLLDVMIPKLDGISLCRRLRSREYGMPILLLTGRDSGHEKAIGLDAGADDYVVKPFDPEELVARIRALLRRGRTVCQLVLTWERLRLDPNSCEVTYNDKPLALTPKEFALLELFLRNSRRVFSCGVILEQVWSFEEMPGEEAVRTHIKGLRQKLKAAGAPTDFVETVYGIGYRLKPVASLERSSTPARDELSAVKEPTQQQTMLLLARVWHKYRERIHQQVSLLEQATADLSRKCLEPALREAAEREAHTLAGSLGTFGLSAGSQLAREIEQLMATRSNNSTVKQLQTLVTSLRQEIEQFLAKSTTPQADDRPQLLIVDQDQHLAQSIVQEAEQWGLRGKIVAGLSAARASIEQELPVAVLLDLTVASAPSEGLNFLAELRQRIPNLPILVMTTQDNLHDRLEVARLGGHAFLQKPIPLMQVLETVNQVLHEGDKPSAKVMVVDDDPQLLAALRSLLEPWGLRVTTLATPQKFWETLESAAPDLLILDIKMPDISGFELCQIVRNDTHWSELPIIFLTAHTDAETVNQVFTLGADDFVSKPIVGPELITRIINRLDRIRTLHRLAGIDPLTGVSNRHRATQELDKLLCLAKRHQQPLCFAILNFEQFNQTGDRAKQAARDATLQQIGQLLLKLFHREDIVARWSDQKFIIGVYGMTYTAGVQKLNQFIQKLQQQTSVAPNSIPSQITPKVGIVEYPKHGEDLRSLYHAANIALHSLQA
jgi:diguanylate cyclase (GGDEF)-like protein